MLGLGSVNGPPEELVGTEAAARAVFVQADASGPGTDMLKAQLLAAKLNAIKFPGFADAQLPSGRLVGDLIAHADQILSDLANGLTHSQSEVVVLSESLDAANNNGNEHVLFIGKNCSTPTPTPTPSPTGVAGEVRPPSGLPPTGGSGGSGTRAVAALALLGAILVAVSVPLLLRSRR